ncbi:hypothetical protein [Pseudomonas sp. RGB]|uniref:hypothetical protein n=1 Tax=Pseudomonas sp. RGB TaxID=2598474 RepID=UPI0011925784|nr:hypothetical protein [Pseudomonas sp. RGB]TVT89188.1 hypothetical protein FPT15_20850 [Pseudomonas sp. RGB]
MDFFLSANLNYINTIQLINAAPPPQPPKPSLDQASAIGLSGANTPDKNNRSGNLESLGKGNLL